MWGGNSPPAAGADASAATESKTASAVAPAVASDGQLLDAMEGLEEGIAIFDAADTLVFCNARYHAINSVIADLLLPGATFEAILRQGVERGLYPAAIGSEDEWLRDRLADHREGVSHFERQESNGHWLQILEQRTPSGGTTILATDITEVKRRELALSMLAVAGQDGGDFFADAVVSLAAGLGYRSAGIGRISGNGSRIEPMASCEAGIVVPGEAFEIAGTPCETVLEEYGFWAVDRDVTEHYPQDERLRRRGAVAFVGDIVCDSIGRPVAVVFATDDKPDPISLKRRDMTGLVAARISLELQQRLTEGRLREAKETAEAANRAKTQLLANMSHELRTPLNAIIGFSQLIGAEALGPAGRPEYRDYARDINASSQNLLQIINDVLDVSRIEAGILKLREAEIDLTAMLRQCQRTIEARASAAEIALASDIPEDLPIIVADETMLKRVVMNLLSNALKFTPKGGQVGITARPDADRGVVISVDDTGIGIAEGDLVTIFDAFTQVDGGLNRRFEGTGLGLPLAKGLVELHGGRISVASTLGQGTTMSIFLPLSSAADDEAADAA